MKCENTGVPTENNEFSNREENSFEALLNVSLKVIDNIKTRLYMPEKK